MDILSLQPSTIVVSLRHPGNGEELGLKIECTSLESDAVRQVERRIRAIALKAGPKAATPERVENAELDLLTAAVVGWTWPDTLDLEGVKHPPCTVQNVRKFFAGCRWAVKQVDTALQDEASFFGSSAAN